MLVFNSGGPIGGSSDAACYELPALGDGGGMADTLQASLVKQGSADDADSLISVFSPLGQSPTTPLSVEAQEPILRIAKQQLAEEPRGSMLSGNMLSVSVPTLVGCSELLGHSLDDRATIQAQQDAVLVAAMQKVSTAQLRDKSQRPLFIIAPLDVLVTREIGANGTKKNQVRGTRLLRGCSHSRRRDPASSLHPSHPHPSCSSTSVRSTEPGSRASPTW
jgi:hypothetical protein